MNRTSSMASLVGPAVMSIERGVGMGGGRLEVANRLARNGSVAYDAENGRGFVPP